MEALALLKRKGGAAVLGGRTRRLLWLRRTTTRAGSWRYRPLAIRNDTRTARPETKDSNRNGGRDLAHINEARFLHIGFPVGAYQIGGFGEPVVFADKLQLHLGDHAIAKLG